MILNQQQINNLKTFIIIIAGNMGLVAPLSVILIGKILLQ